MSDRKRSGCVVAAVVGLLAVAGIVALFLVFSFKAARAGKREALEYMERLEERAELRAAEEKGKSVAAIELREGELADYSGYKLFAPLSPEVFLSWRLDQGATTLAKEAFVQTAEGAQVSWELQAGDLRTEGDKIVGVFYLPYVFSDRKGTSRQAGVESIECRFAPESKESLLVIRRDRPARIAGRLSLAGGNLVIKDARLATEDVEK